MDDPVLQKELTSELRRRLPEVTDAVWSTLLVEAAADIGAKELYPLMLEAYRNKKVETSLLPAAEARQLVMGGGNKGLRQRLHLSFWQRYDLDRAILERINQRAEGQGAHDHDHDHSHHDHSHHHHH